MARLAILGKERLWIQEARISPRAKGVHRIRDIDQIRLAGHPRPFIDVNPCSALHQAAHEDVHPGQIWSRNDPATVNQEWRFDDVMIKGIGDKCLEVAGFDFRSGARIQLWDCHGLVNQRWTVDPSGEIRSRGGDGGWCLDVPWGQASWQNPLQLVRCSGGAAQRFQANDLGELKFGGLCLDVRGGGVANGSVVQLYGCAGGAPHQQWHLTGPVHGQSSKCMDIAGGPGSGNRAAVQVWGCHGGSNQEWDYYFKE